MKVLLITGNHPRHNYLASFLQRNGFLQGLIVEEREAFVPAAPEELAEEFKGYFKEHFSKRESAENDIFKAEPVEIENRLAIQPKELNSDKVLNFIKALAPDIVITTGIGILRKEILESLPKEIWNIHGGLSPDVKGAITHFWPSYMLRPQHTGCTIHYISVKIDEGAIIHQTPSILVKGNGLHQLSGRTLKEGYEAIVPLIKRYIENGEIKTVVQKKTGKLWQIKDWTPYHLKLIYGTYGDRIVDAYLAHELPGEVPKLIDNALL